MFSDSISICAFILLRHNTGSNFARDAIGFAGFLFYRKIHHLRNPYKDMLSSGTDYIRREVALLRGKLTSVCRSVLWYQWMDSFWWWKGELSSVTKANRQVTPNNTYWRGNATGWLLPIDDYLHSCRQYGFRLSVSRIAVFYHLWLSGLIYWAGMAQFCVMASLHDPNGARGISIR